MRGKLSGKRCDAEPRLRDLPPLGDGEAIIRFAASFNGYEHFGSLHACADAAHEKRRETLVDLRNELFFAYRAGNHCGDDRVIATYAELHPYFVSRLPA